MKSPEEFIERIKRSFQTPSSKDERIKVVLICFIISTTFWFFSALNQDDYITQINYPIQVKYDQEQFVAVGEIPENVPLEVTGGGWDLMARSFGLSMEPIVLNVSNPAETSFILTSSLRGELAPNLDPVAINFILEDSIVFDLQKVVTKTIQIKVEPTQIDLANDYIIDSRVSVEPSVIDVVGPESLVEVLGDTIFVQLDDTSIDEDYNNDLVIPSFGDLITLENDRVNVSFRVERLVSIDYNYPISLVNAPDDNWDILPNYLPVNILMKSAYFDATDTTMFELQVDYSKQSADSLAAIEVINIQGNILEYSIELDSVKLFRNE